MTPPGRPPPRTPPPPRPPGSAAGPGGMIRAPRPLPPRIIPPGIPEGQPLPPSTKVDNIFKQPPAPSRAPPLGVGGGRAPPKEDPEEYEARMLAKRTQQPPAPTTEPPLLRVKKPRDEGIVLKRREKDMPEFESSDEEEEQPDYVKQPLPFGVLKQAVPKTTAQIKEEEEQAKKDAAAAARAAALAATRRKSIGGESISSATVTAPPLTNAPAREKENKLQGFLPSAPTGANSTGLGVEQTQHKHFDESKLGATLTRGRFSIKCMEGHDIRRKDDPDHVPRNDPFIRFKLGAADRHTWKNTATHRKQGSNPQFLDEIISFDVLDPAQYVFEEDLQLCIELWNKSVTKNELVASVTMSVVRFFKQPFISYREKVPIYYPGATRTPMKVGKLLHI